MTARIPFRIRGLGRALPERIVTSREIEQEYGIEENWIESKTGIQTRRWVTHETALTLAAAAAREAVAEAGMELTDLDLILWASGTPPQAIPDGAHLLQRELGLGHSGISCMAVHATCLSFVSAMDTASAFLAAGRYERILIVSSDVASRGFDRSDPKSFTLFGDAAAAAVVTRPGPGEEDSQVLISRFESYGHGADLAHIKGWGTLRPPGFPETRDTDNVFHMDGPGVFFLVRELIPPFLLKMNEARDNPDEIPLIVPHQPSMHALRGFRRAGIPEEKMVITLDRYGNCVAVSIPLTLYEAVKTGRLKRGEEFLMMGIGAGICLGGMLLRY